MDRGVKGLSDTLNNSLKSRVAAAFGTAAIGLAVKKTIDYGSAIADTSKRLAVNAEWLQETTYAAEQNGASMEDVTSAMEKMNIARADALAGNEELQESFENLGVSMDDLKQKRGEDIFNAAANAVRSGDAQALGKDLRNVGGRSIGNLVAAFKGGLDEMAAEAHAKGIVIAEPVISSLDSLGDSMTELRHVMMANLAPAIVWIANKFIDLVDSIKDAGTFVGALSGNPNFNLKNAAKSLTETGKHPEGASWWDKLWSMPQKGSGPATDALRDAIAEAVNQVAGNKSSRPSNIGAPESMNFVSGFSEREKKAKSFRPTTDSLVSVGNFLGSSQSAFSQIAQKQLDVQKEALRVHYQILQKLSASSGVPSIFPI